MASQEPPPQGGPQPGPPPFRPGPGQQPTQEQIQAMQRQIAIDAEKNGMTVPQFLEKLKEQQQRVAQAQQKMNQHREQQQMQQPIQPGPPKPEALAVANFLKSQNLKPRTCILNGQRKDMFKVKRALRALQSPEYEKARKKNHLLPQITDRASLENTFKLLPLSLLALRVSKIDPPETGKKAKRVKGLWTVKIEQQQECREELHFVWLYEGTQIRQKLMAVGAILLVFTIVMFPLWPLTLRIGVWYLSMGALGLLGLFFAMAIFRLILFGITMFAVPPGLWLYPNLFEDVGFFDSFRPLWAWHETKKKKKKGGSASAQGAQATAAMASLTGQVPQAQATTTGSAPQLMTGTGVAEKRNLAPRVEEVADDEE